MPMTKSKSEHASFYIPFNGRNNDLTVIGFNFTVTPSGADRTHSGVHPFYYPAPDYRLFNLIGKVGIVRYEPDSLFLQV